MYASCASHIWGSKNLVYEMSKLCISYLRLEEPHIWDGYPMIQTLARLIRPTIGVTDIRDKDIFTQLIKTLWNGAALRASHMCTPTQYRRELNGNIIIKSRYECLMSVQGSKNLRLSQLLNVAYNIHSTPVCIMRSRIISKKAGKEREVVNVLFPSRTISHKTGERIWRSLSAYLTQKIWAMGSLFWTQIIYIKYVHCFVSYWIQ